MDIEIAWTQGSDTVSWSYRGERIQQTYELPPRSVTYVDNPPSIIVVEAIQSSGPANAAVYDLDGTERLRLNPLKFVGSIGFDQVFRSKDTIEAVFVTRNGDFHGNPDLLMGELKNVHEWR